MRVRLSNIPSDVASSWIFHITHNFVMKVVKSRQDRCSFPSTPILWSGTLLNCCSSTFPAAEASDSSTGQTVSQVNRAVEIFLSAAEVYTAVTLWSPSWNLASPFLREQTEHSCVWVLNFVHVLHPQMCVWALNF